MTIAMKKLQEKVNQIAEKLDGIETIEKLDMAKKIARQDEEIQGLMLEILDNIISRKWRRDSNLSVRNFWESKND